MCNFVKGAVTYAQRARGGGPEQWRRFDDELVKILGGWLGSPLSLSVTSRPVLFMPAKFGGGGMASAERRTDAAFVASWTQVERAVYRAQGVDTREQSELAAPALHHVVHTARSRIGAAGGSVAESTQKAMVKSLVVKERNQLLHNLEDDAAALLHSRWLKEGRGCCQHVANALR